jgi:hypothetical protein
MVRAGAQEILIPPFTMPRSGGGRGVIRSPTSCVTDRRGRDCVLGMTHGDRVAGRGEFTRTRSRRRRLSDSDKFATRRGRA